MNRNLLLFFGILFSFISISSEASQFRLSKWFRSSKKQSAPHAFLERSKKENRQNILASAKASKVVYDIYKDFKENPKHYRQSQQNKGFYRGKGLSTYMFGNFPYKVDGVFCGDNALNQKECGLFLTFFKALDSKSNLPPVISVKGSSTLGDWGHNLLNRGSFYLEWLVDVLDANSFLDYQNDEELNASYEYMQDLIGNHAIVTGHSLGGGLAQALALSINEEYSDHRTPQIDVITFNSLAGESLMDRLHSDLKGTLARPTRWFFRIDDDHNYSFEQGDLPENINALNITTEDDILQGINSLIRRKNLGARLKIPSKRDVYQESTLLFLKDQIEGHLNEAIDEDLAFLYSPNALKFVEKKIRENSSPQGLLNIQKRTRDYLFHYTRTEIDDQYAPSGEKLEAYYQIYRYPVEKTNLYRRMKDFLKNPEVRHIMGIE